MRTKITQLREEELIFLREYWGKSIILSSEKDISLALEITEKTFAWRAFQVRLAFKDLIREIKKSLWTKRN